MKKAIAILLTAVLLAGLMLMAGCGAKSYEVPAAAPIAGNGYYAESSYAADMAPAEEAVWEEEAYYEKEEGALTTSEKPAEADSSAPASEKIIYTADVSLESTEFDSAVEALEALVSELNGYVENSNVSGTTRYNADGTTRVVNRYAYYTVAIPSGSFNEALNRAGTLGNVVSKSRNAENITSRYTDTEARVESLEVQEERILAMMKETTDIESLITLEARLSDITYEKESYQRTLKNYDRQVAYSTINFCVREVEVYTPTASVTRSFGEKLGDAFSDGWHSFTNAIENFVLWFVEALPHLIIWAVIIFAVIMIVRKSKPRRQEKKAMREAEKARKAAEAAAAKNGSLPPYPPQEQ